MITSKDVDQAPQFTLTIRDWKTGGSRAADFTFTPPAGATKLDAKDLETLKDTSDLPEITGLERQMTMPMKLAAAAGIRTCHRRGIRSGRTKQPAPTRSA